MKRHDLIPFFVVSGVILVGIAMILGCQLYKDSKNREAYYECLKTVERLANDDHRPGIRIVSVPTCSLR